MNGGEERGGKGRRGEGGDWARAPRGKNPLDANADANVPSADAG